MLQIPPNFSSGINWRLLDVCYTVCACLFIRRGVRPTRVERVFPSTSPVPSLHTFSLTSIFFPLNISLYFRSVTIYYLSPFFSSMPINFTPHFPLPFSSIITPLSFSFFSFITSSASFLSLPPALLFPHYPLPPNLHIFRAINFKRSSRFIRRLRSQVCQTLRWLDIYL